MEVENLINDETFSRLFPTDSKAAVPLVLEITNDVIPFGMAAHPHDLVEHIANVVPLVEVEGLAISASPRLSDCDVRYFEARIRNYMPGDVEAMAKRRSYNELMRVAGVTFDGKGGWHSTKGAA